MKPDEDDDIQDLIQPGSLVIIFDEDAKPPIRHGIILKKFPSGNFDVKVKPTKEDARDQILTSGQKISLLAQTDGKFDDPEQAFDHHLPEIIDNVIITWLLSREYRAIQRLKYRAKRLNRTLRQRIRGSLSAILGLAKRLPFVGGRDKPQNPS